MHPELITLHLPGIGALTITTFGAMMALAFLAGYAVIRTEARRHGRDPELAADVLLGALIGGIVGAKLYYVLLYWGKTGADPIQMLFSRSGLVWYGGFIGGTLGVILALRRRGVRIASGADLCAPALAISYGIGRLGCFGVGDDYGRPTSSWIGIAFPNGSPPSTAGNLRRWGIGVDPSIPDSQVLTVHPTQLYEAGLALLIFLILWRMRKWQRPDGWLFGAWMVMAGVERLFIEMFRAKDDRFFGPLTLAQLISLAVMGFGAYLLLRTRRGSVPEGGHA